MASISVFLTNLSQYVSGRLVGEWINLPITAEELEAVYKRIGIDGEHEETFITDYQSEIDGLHVGEYDSIEQLNELAEQIEDLDDYELDKIEAAVEAYGGELAEYINKVDDIIYYEGYTFEDLAEELAVSGYFGEALQALYNERSYYIDFDALIRDLEIGDNYRKTSGGVVHVAA